MESFLGPVKWHRADRRVPFGAQKTRQYYYIAYLLLNHSLVQNLKLNVNERERIDLEISREELDVALDGANCNSAAGIDGISTKFIKRYWEFFREPLYKYAKSVFVKGRLTRSFKTAIIKLIPKKGLAKDIRKWRPISLLSCMYKVLSRAVNNRLKSVVNRFTSRAQKGFTNHRFIQEVLINVCSTINHCNINNIEGALLSIDQSRAFDTISHKYMTEVYRFFGFGENFINITLTQLVLAGRLRLYLMTVQSRLNSTWKQVDLREMALPPYSIIWGRKSFY